MLEFISYTIGRLLPLAGGVGGYFLAQSSDSSISPEIVFFCMYAMVQIGLLSNTVENIESKLK